MQYARFLLPSLHIKMILDMPTIFERREALKILPTDLYKSFQSILTRIKGQPKSKADLGMCTLMWLHFARRPLKLVELQHALAVKKKHVEFEASNIPSLKVLLDCCVGLVLVDEETLTVRFTHFTLEEFFRDNAGSEFPNGCSSIAETCLTYLNFAGLRQHCPNLDSLEEKSTQYALLNYAALYWGAYVKQQCSDSLMELARGVLEHESERPPCAIQALYFHISQKESLAKRFSGIHVAAYFGLNETVANLSLGTVELKDETDRTPISWAAGNGHEGVVRRLIERSDVDVDAKDDCGSTPLIWAAENGHETVVRLLIERDDVDINAKDNQGKTPLICAAKRGREAVVSLLIERDDVDIGAMDNEGKTALSWAVAGVEAPSPRDDAEGLQAVVRLLNGRCGVQAGGSDTAPATPLL